MKKGQRVHSEKKFYFWLAVAAMLHVIVLSTAFFLQILDARKQPELKIVSISLVSLPITESAPAIITNPSVTKPSLPPVTKTDKHPASRPSPLNKPMPKKLVALEKIPVPKSAEKPDLSSALERLKQVVGNKAQSQPSSPGSTVKRALAELEKRVNSEKVSAVSGGSGERVGVTGGNSGAGKEYGGSGASAYRTKIASIIQRNWELANPLLKNSFGMKVTVRINIFSDGTIGQIFFVKKSLSEYLNNSVKKALEKSSPLPPLPREEGTHGVWVVFVFTPEGIEP